MFIEKIQPCLLLGRQRRREESKTEGRERGEEGRVLHIGSGSSEGNSTG